MKINVVYNKDFRENDIPSNSIDLVVTDPPYKTITGGDSDGANSQRPKGMLQGNRKLFKFQKLKISEWITEIYRVLKEQTHCYVFTNSLNMEEILAEGRKAGFKIHNILVWQKQNCTPSQYYMKNCEYVILFRKGRAKYINNIGSSKTVHEFLLEDNMTTIKVNNIIGNKLHPCEKPIDLLRLYITNSSNENDVVLDPFMGSGSLACACISENRKYIGYEIDKEYYDISKKRIANDL